LAKVKTTGNVTSIEEMTESGNPRQPPATTENNFIIVILFYAAPQD
jgi:hypothetical protein